MNLSVERVEPTPILVLLDMLATVKSSKNSDASLWVDKIQAPMSMQTSAQRTQRRGARSSDP